MRLYFWPKCLNQINRNVSNQKTYAKKICYQNIKIKLKEKLIFDSKFKG